MFPPLQERESGFWGVGVWAKCRVSEVSLASALLSGAGHTSAFIIPRRPHSLGIVPFCGRDSGYVEVLGVRQLNVCAKRFIELFAGLLLSTRSFGHSLFEADDLMTLRTFAEAMTGSIHFVPWPKPTCLGQFWLFHAPSFPQARRFGYPLDIQTDPLAHTCPPRTIRCSVSLTAFSV
jgi:hypothetical protein